MCKAGVLLLLCLQMHLPPLGFVLMPNMNRACFATASLTLAVHTVSNSLHMIQPSYAKCQQSSACRPC